MCKDKKKKEDDIFYGAVCEAGCFGGLDDVIGCDPSCVETKEGESEKF